MELAPHHSTLRQMTRTDPDSGPGAGPSASLPRDGTDWRTGRGVPGLQAAQGGDGRFVLEYRYSGGGPGDRQDQRRKDENGAGAILAPSRSEPRILTLKPGCLKIREPTFQSIS